MSEFKKCMRVFSHSPFKVRLMLYDMINGKPEQENPPLLLLVLDKKNSTNEPIYGWDTDNYYWRRRT